MQKLVIPYLALEVVSGASSLGTVALCPFTSNIASTCIVIVWIKALCPVSTTNVSLAPVKDDAIVLWQFSQRKVYAVQIGRYRQNIVAKYQLQITAASKKYRAISITLQPDQRQVQKAWAAKNGVIVR